MFTYYWKAWVVRNTPLQVLDVRVTSGEKAGLTERCSTDVDTYTLCTSVCFVHMSQSLSCTGAEPMIFIGIGSA